MKIKHIIAVCVVIVAGTVAGASFAAEKATLKEEKRGALAGAVVGAAVAGPVGAGAGAMIGGGVFGKLFGYKRINNELELALEDQIIYHEQYAEELNARVKELNQDLDLLVAESANWRRRQLPIQFKTASSEVESHYRSQLDDVARVLTRNLDTQVVLSGFADKRGDEQYNQELSAQRVSEVRAYLLSHGVKPSQVVTHSFGESLPLSASDSAEDYFFDRRVVMEFEFDIQSQLATR